MTEEKAATDAEMAEWNPAGRNIAAAVYPWRVARLIARIDRDRALIEAGRQAVGALKAISEKVEAVGADPSFLSVAAIASIHGCVYDGPTWLRELQSAKDALAAWDKAQEASK